MMGILVLSLILGCIPGAIAQKKGRSFVLWWIFGALLLVVALPASLMIGRKHSRLKFPSTPSDDSDLIGNRLVRGIRARITAA